MPGGSEPVADARAPRVASSAAAADAAAAAAAAAASSSVTARSRGPGWAGGVVGDVVPLAPAAGRTGGVGGFALVTGLRGEPVPASERAAADGDVARLPRPGSPPDPMVLRSSLIVVPPPWP